jgi:Uma2 family endonuclease
MSSVDPDIEWPRPPQGGYTADDLDRLPHLPPHTELIDGSLVFMSPQRNFHRWMLRLLEYQLSLAAPAEYDVIREMTVTLGPRNRPEPDIMVVHAKSVGGDEQTTFQPADVLVAVEVVSPDSEERDRDVKPRKYAEAGIRHFWRVEKAGEGPALFVFELDPATRQYVPTGIFHGKVSLLHPFPLELDLGEFRERPS